MNRPIYFYPNLGIIENKNSPIYFEENWKPINGWENLYLIGNFGNVYSLYSNRLVVGDTNNYEYKRVTLYKNGKGKHYFRHRLVAQHFLQNPNGYKFVNHKTGNKNHNEFYNIEWTTQSENEKHAFRTGLKRKTNKPFIVEFENGSKERFENQYEFADRYNMTQLEVSYMIRKKKYFGNIINIYFIN